MTTLQEKVAELRSIEGCLGGFASVDGRCMASSLPPIYDQQRLDRVASSIRKLAAVTEKSGYPQADFAIKLGKATLLVFALGGTRYLTLACEATANIATVEIFAGVAADDIREAIAALPPPAPAEVRESQPEILVAPAAAERPSVETRRTEARAAFGAKLDTAKSLFIREVGPIGEMIFSELFDAWLAAGPVTWARSAELRDRLAAEIDDASDRARFSKDPVWK